MADDAILGGTVDLGPTAETITVDRVRLSVVAGPKVGQAREVAGERITIGSHALNDLVIEDAAVSRFHCELRFTHDGMIVVDLGSKNGTLVDGVRVREAYVRPGGVLVLGGTSVRVDAAGAERLAVAAATRFGSLVGTSLAMRRTITRLARAAQSDVTLLLLGETGTGKGRAAEAVHRASSRAAAPLVVVDCSAIPTNLLESELFGHEKGAFTGAHERRVGAFEEASGGTLFLDEIGELPHELQPKLLRALENREVRRIGANRFVPIDLRVIAATNRDLRAEVNAGRFRSDLYYRLAVAAITLPPLRERRDDIPAIVDELLEQLRATAAGATRVRHPSYLASLASHEWPGNVRELRNHLERGLAFADDDEPLAQAAPPSAPGEVTPYSDAKKRAQDAFERDYLTQLLVRFDHKVPAAAQAAGIDRVYLYRLLRRQGIKPRE